MDDSQNQADNSPVAKTRRQFIPSENGLCLNVLHDKAFDRGLITVSPDLTIFVSPELKKLQEDPFAVENLVSLEGTKIRLPEKFAPAPEILKWHWENVFRG